MKNFLGTSKTKGGIECVVSELNEVYNFYLGKVKDNWSSIPGRAWTTCAWRINGKCVNRNRPELDLI